MVKVIFYKGKGTLFDSLIRWWTCSPYSHCEIVVGAFSFTASARWNKVAAFDKATIDPEKWDVVEVDAPPLQVTSFFQLTEGNKYDWLGILFTQLFPFSTDSKRRYYCSEWCAEALNLKNHALNPQELYEILTYDRSSD